MSCIFLYILNLRYYSDLPPNFIHKNKQKFIYLETKGVFVVWSVVCLYDLNTIW